MDKDITLKELSEALANLLREYPEAANCKIGVKYDYGYGTTFITSPLTFDTDDFKENCIRFEGN